MIEDLEFLEDGSKALVTSRSAQQAIRFEYCPSVWKVSNEVGAEPLEFCNLSLLPSKHEFPRIDDHLVSEFAKTAAEYDVDDYLGVCLISKDALPYDKLTQVQVEYVDVCRAANVVLVRPKPHVNGQRYIETTWEFSASSTMSCARNCYRYCVEYSPGHAYKHHSWHAISE